MSGLDFRHNMEAVRNENGSYSAHVFADRAVKLVRQHAVYNKDQVNTKVFCHAYYKLSEITLFTYHEILTKIKIQ